MVHRRGSGQRGGRTTRRWARTSNRGLDRLGAPAVAGAAVLLTAAAVLGLLPGEAAGAATVPAHSAGAASSGPKSCTPAPDADLTGCDLSNRVLTGANLSDADLTAATLESSNLTGANLSGANLTATDLTNTTLQNAELTGANLTATVLAGTDLSGATLTGVGSRGVSGTPYSLPVFWILIHGRLVGPGAKVPAADLSGADLSNGHLAGADFSGANLSGADLAAADLSGADLSGAHLQDADLSIAGLRGAKLEGAGLAYATLTGVQSGGISGTPKSLPAGWLLARGYLVGEGAWLTGADLGGADLTNAVFTRADLDTADLSDAHLNGASSGNVQGTPKGLPTGWHLGGGYLIGPGARLVDADLRGFDLVAADLTGTDLARANLSGANLSGADLAKTNLEGTDLSKADLTGVLSGGITGTPDALPSGWVLKNGTLYGPGPDDCDLDVVCTTGIHVWSPVGAPTPTAQWGNDASRWLGKTCSTDPAGWESYCGLVPTTNGMGTVGVKNTSLISVEVSSSVAGSFPSASQVGMVVLKPGETRCFDVAGPTGPNPGYYLDVGYLNWLTRRTRIGSITVVRRTTSGGGCGSNGLNMAFEPPDAVDGRGAQWGEHDNPSPGYTCYTSDDRTRPNGPDSWCGGVESEDRVYTVTTGAVRLQNTADPRCLACQVRVVAYMPGQIIPQANTPNQPIFYWQTGFFGIGSYVLAPGEEACFAFRGRTNEVDLVSHHITVQRPDYAPAVEVKVTGLATSGTNCVPKGLNMTTPFHN